MAQSSRARRKRAAVRSAKRSRTNTWWYGLTALVLIAGVALVVYSRATAPPTVGPYILNRSNPNDPHNKDSHWHAALGVYDCDHWASDGSGEGVWAWPAATSNNAPGRVGTDLYAGLHSHADGLIHMEPSSTDESGRRATIGKYFTFGGWKVSATGFDFLGVKRSNGDKCGDTPGRLVWEVAKWDGTANPQKYVVQTGSPAQYKLYDGDIVVIAFLRDGTSIDSIGDPPSVQHLPGASQREGQMPPVTTTVPGSETTVTTGATTGTTAGSTATTAGSTATTAGAPGTSNP